MPRETVSNFLTRNYSLPQLVFQIVVNFRKRHVRTCPSFALSRSEGNWIRSRAYFLKNSSNSERIVDQEPPRLINRAILRVFFVPGWGCEKRKWDFSFVGNCMSGWWASLRKGGQSSGKKLFMPVWEGLILNQNSAKRCLMVFQEFPSHWRGKCEKIKTEENLAKIPKIQWLCTSSSLWQRLYY